MNEEIEAHIAAVEDTYRPLMLGSASRLTGGERLWAQFEQTVVAFRRYGRAQITGIVERVNELAMAKCLLNDPHIPAAKILYEPEIVRGGPRFDFVVPDYLGATLYIEVKTVQPRTEDNEEKWRKTERRLHNVSPNNHYIVAEEWMGAAIFGDAFSARSAFLSYALETEAKLECHVAIKPGRTVLVFCGNGFAWDVDELEDFVDFYRTGRHRDDDPFAAMEDHDIRARQVILRRNIEAFGTLIRTRDQVEPTKWMYPVRGPRSPC